MSNIRVTLGDDDLLAATVHVWELEQNRQPDLPPYVNGENCDVCGRGVPRWEFVQIAYSTGRTCCSCCDDPDDDGSGYQVGRSSGGQITCQGCGLNVWAPTPQIRRCEDCSPELWRDLEAAGSVAQIVARLTDHDDGT
jgi:hypothetical protein